MSTNTVTGEENLYFELQSKDATTADVYEDMGVEGGKTPVTEGGEKRSKVFNDLEPASSQPDAVIANRSTSSMLLWSLPSHCRCHVRLSLDDGDVPKHSKFFVTR